LDEFELARIGQEGIRDLPSLVEAARWCWGQSENTGDARYASLGRAFDAIVAAFDDQGLPMATVDKLNGVLREQLTEVLSADPPDRAVRLAARLREDIQDIIEHMDEDF